MYQKTVQEWKHELVAEGAIFFPDTSGREWDRINESFAGYFMARQGSPGDAEAKRVRDRMAKELRKDGWTVWVEPRSVMGGSDTAEYPFSTMRKKEGVGRTMAQKTEGGDLLDDWKTFVEDFFPRNFKAFEPDPNDKPEGYADLVVKAIRAGDPTLVEDEIISNASDYLNQAQDQAFIECRAEFLKVFEDPEVSIEFDGDTEFDSIFNEIYVERRYMNALDLVRGLNLLVWNKKNQASLGWAAPNGPQDAVSEIGDNETLRNFFYDAEDLAGITVAQERELVVNGFDFDVQALIGGIIDAEELLRNMESPDEYGWVEVDESVVAFWDGLNGAGYFVYGKKRVKIDVAHLKDNSVGVDFGSYSLGDIFGGVDGSWRAK